MRKLVPVIPALSIDERLGNMRASALHDFPRLKKLRPFRQDWLTLACFGPSLKRTWTKVTHPLMTVSGAHDFLISGGVVPDYHVECDPREHKTTFTKNSHEGVHYLMASVCHPSVWGNLQGKRVTVWHVYGEKEINDWIEGQKEVASLAAGGSTVGLRAMEVAGILGFRKLVIHGMDCSYETTKHAGEHPNETEREIELKLNGRIFKTSPQLYESAREFVELILKHRADIEVRMCGDGLLPELLKTCKELRKAA
jgi:uncharacterized Rossmann fold enzyme